MNETKPKKMVSKNVAIALGIICIVLVALIAYFTVTGISATNSYNNLQNQNKQLQAWLIGNETLLNQTQTWLIGNETLLNQTQAWLEGNITAYNNYISDHHNSDEDYDNLADTVANYSSIISLNDSTVLFNNTHVDLPPEGNWSYSTTAAYAGYIEIQVWTLPSTPASISVVYNGYGVIYDVSMSFYEQGTWFAPILPLIPIKLEIGNGDSLIGTNVQFTITYYY